MLNLEGMENEFVSKKKGVYELGKYLKLTII